MRIAAIDIGTNSIHMIVVQVRQDLSFEVIDREKAMVRLGAGGLGGRALSRDAMTLGLQTLIRFKKLAESNGVEEVLAAATSATREARNGGGFLERIARDTGIRPRVIPGAEEARLIHQAAVYGVDVGAGRAVVVDVGGGSVEITAGPAAGSQVARSFKLGVLRLTERFVKSDPISERDERKLTRHILDTIDRHCEQIVAEGFDRVIGTSGTILSVGAVARAAARGTPPQEFRNLRVPAKLIRRVRKDIVASNLEERLQMPGLDPRRADLAVAGVVLVDTILRRLGGAGLVGAGEVGAHDRKPFARGEAGGGRPRVEPAPPAGTPRTRPRLPTFVGAACLSSPSAVTTMRATLSRWSGWRWRSSTRAA